MRVVILSAAKNPRIHSKRHDPRHRRFLSQLEKKSKPPLPPRSTSAPQPFSPRCEKYRSPPSSSRAQAAHSPTTVIRSAPIPASNNCRRFASQRFNRIVPASTPKSSFAYRNFRPKLRTHLLDQPNSNKPQYSARPPPTKSSTRDPYSSRIFATPCSTIRATVPRHPA